MQARLVVYRNGEQELCVPIGEPGAGIGRDSCNAVQLAMHEVSKQHAFLQFGNDGWRVRDLNSRNGLYVNGHQVQTEPMPYDKLVARFGLRSPSEASNLLITAKRMFARALHEIVRETVSDDQDVEPEIRELKRILAK